MKKTKPTSEVENGARRKLRLGWIGSGFVGQVAHLSNFNEIPDVEIVALAELRPKLGRQVADRLGIHAVYPNHTELLAAEHSLDAVVAIVRREHTASVALDVLRSGVALLTEKPMAPTVSQAEDLVGAAVNSDVLYSNGFMRRHDDGVRKAKKIFDELIDSEEIGQPVFFRAYCFGGGDYCNISGDIRTDEPPPRHRILPIAPDWIPCKLEREYERFLNVFVHDINLIRFITGECPDVEHVQYQPASGSVGLEFRDFPGVFEFAHLDTDQYWEEGFEIVFSKGRLKVELAPAFLRNQPARVEITKELSSIDSLSAFPRAGWTWAFRNQALAFVENVLLGSQPLASGEDSINDLKVVESIWRKIV